MQQVDMMIWEFTASSCFRIFFNFNKIVANGLTVNYFFSKKIVTFFITPEKKGQNFALELSVMCSIGN